MLPKIVSKYWCRFTINLNSYDNTSVFLQSTDYSKSWPFAYLHLRNTRQYLLTFCAITMSKLRGRTPLSLYPFLHPLHFPPLSISSLSSLVPPVRNWGARYALTRHNATIKMVASPQSSHHIIFTKSEPWTRLSKWFGHCDSVTVILQNGQKNCTVKLYLWKTCHEQVLQAVEPARLLANQGFHQTSLFSPNLGLRLWLLLTPCTNQAPKLKHQAVIYF